MVSFLADLTPQDEIDKRKAALGELPDMDPCVRYYQKLESGGLEPGEFIFVLDRSYSMSGTPIEVAKEALKLFLRSIPPGSYFNVVSFGSNFVSAFPEPVVYSKANLEKAIAEL